MVKNFLLILLVSLNSLLAQDEIQTSEIKTHIVFLKKDTPLIELKTNKMVKNSDDVYLKAYKGFDKEGYTLILDKKDNPVYKVDFKYIQQNNTITDMRTVPYTFNTDYIKDENVYTHFKESSIYFEFSAGAGTAKYGDLPSKYPIATNIMTNIYLKWRFALEMGGGYEYSRVFITSENNKYETNGHYVGAILRYPIYMEDPLAFYFGMKFYQALNLVLSNKTSSESSSLDAQKIGTFFQLSLNVKPMRVNLGVNYDREWITPKTDTSRSTNNVILFNIGLDYEWIL